MPFQRQTLTDAYKCVEDRIFALNVSWASFYAKLSVDALHCYVTSDDACCTTDKAVLESWFEGYCIKNGIVVDEGFTDSGYAIPKEHPEDLIIFRSDFNRAFSRFYDLVCVAQRDIRNLPIS